MSTFTNEQVKELQELIMSSIEKNFARRKRRNGVSENLDDQNSNNNNNIIVNQSIPIVTHMSYEEFFKKPENFNERLSFNEFKRMSNEEIIEYMECMIRSMYAIGSLQSYECYKSIFINNIHNDVAFIGNKAKTKFLFKNNHYRIVLSFFHFDFNMKEKDVPLRASQVDVYNALVGSLIKLCNGESLQFERPKYNFKPRDTTTKNKKKKSDESSDDIDDAEEDEAEADAEDDEHDAEHQEQQRQQEEDDNEIFMDAEDNADVVVPVVVPPVVVAPVVQTEESEEHQNKKRRIDDPDLTQPQYLVSSPNLPPPVVPMNTTTTTTTTVEAVVNNNTTTTPTVTTTTAAKKPPVKPQPFSLASKTGDRWEPKIIDRTLSVRLSNGVTMKYSDWRKDYDVKRVPDTYKADICYVEFQQSNGEWMDLEAYYIKFMKEKTGENMEGKSFDVICSKYKFYRDR